jgi:F0F1-type ATP synthase assembly protein I
MLGLGSQMLSEVVAGVLLGYGLDYMLGTKNRWIVVGAIAGVAVAMVSVFRVALRPQTPRRQNPAQRSVGQNATSESQGKNLSAASSADSDNPPASKDRSP